MSSSLSAVVPVYNSEGTLAELVARVTKVLATQTDKFEIVLVNDGSRDGSWEEILRLGKKNPAVHGVNLMRNYGQHNALLAGIRAARCDVIVTLDDDLQNPPEEIPKLLAELTENIDVVYGRPEKQQHGFLRDIASEISKIALKSAVGAETARHVSAFRVFRTMLRDGFSSYRSSFLSIDVLLTWATTRFTAVVVVHDERKMGESNYNFRKLVTHALNMMTGFSVMPLQLASLIGFSFTVLGGLLLTYVVGRVFITGRVVPGFAFLASIISIFSGAQMFAIGIIGEYMARMHFRMMEKPTYMVREECMKQKMRAA